MTQDPRQYQGQYPNPYPSPYAGPDPMAMAYGGYPVSFDPYATLRLPAKRAGLMMIIVGSLSLVCGLCMSMGTYMIVHPPSGPEWNDFNQKRTQMLAQLQASGQSPEAALVMSVAVAVVGLMLLVLGFPVRGGGKVIVRVAFGAVSLIFAVMTLFFLRDLIAILGTGRVEYLPSLTVPAIPLVLFAMMAILLFQANRNTGRLGAAQAQYQQQFWQYQQQQQAYSQGGYPPQPYYGAPPSAFQPPLPPPQQPLQAPPQPPPGDPPVGGAA